MSLIPLDVAGITASFLIFQCIGEFGSACTEGEVERRVGQEDDATSHFETVQVARERCSGHGNAFVVEVVARREVDVPAFG